MLIGKELFGGTGRNVFNPALVGRCFLALAYPKAPITSSLATLAGKLDNGMKARDTREGFFRKVVDLFF